MAQSKKLKNTAERREFGLPRLDPGHDIQENLSLPGRASPRAGAVGALGWTIIPTAASNFGYIYTVCMKNTTSCYNAVALGWVPGWGRTPVVGDAEQLESQGRPCSYRAAFDGV